MNTQEVMNVLAGMRNDQPVVCHLGVVAEAWYNASHSEEDTFYMHSSMGMVSSFALGLAQALPNRLIWAFDGDGALSMNLGTLLTLADNPPRNVVHFVFNSGMYESTGCDPIPAGETVDFAGIARAAGLPHAYTVDNLDHLKMMLPEVTAGEHYSLVVLKVERGDRKKLLKGISGVPSGVPTHAVEIGLKFIRYIERTEGMKILR